MTSFSRPVQLRSGESIEGFHCGCDAVDRWAAERAASARSRGTAVVYVSRTADGRVAGFYSLSVHSVKRIDVTGGWFVRNAPEEVPAILLGMLGVDGSFRGRGLGAALLRDAILNAEKVAAIAGARALIVDPADEGAARFYLKYGFRRLPGTARMGIKLRIAS